MILTHILVFTKTLFIDNGSIGSKPTFILNLAIPIRSYTRVGNGNMLIILNNYVVFDLGFVNVLIIRDAINSLQYTKYEYLNASLPVIICIN